MYTEESLKPTNSRYFIRDNFTQSSTKVSRVIVSQDLIHHLSYESKILCLQDTKSPKSGVN